MEPQFGSPYLSVSQNTNIKPRDNQSFDPTRNDIDLPPVFMEVLNQNGLIENTQRIKIMTRDSLTQFILNFFDDYSKQRGLTDCPSVYFLKYMGQQRQIDKASHKNVANAIALSLGCYAQTSYEMKFFYEAFSQKSCMVKAIADYLYCRKIVKTFFYSKPVLDEVKISFNVWMTLVKKIFKDQALPEVINRLKERISDKNKRKALALLNEKKKNDTPSKTLETALRMQAQSLEVEALYFIVICVEELYNFQTITTETSMGNEPRITLSPPRSKLSQSGFSRLYTDLLDENFKSREEKNSVNPENSSHGFHRCQTSPQPNAAIAQTNKSPGDKYLSIPRDKSAPKERLDASLITDRTGLDNSFVQSIKKTSKEDEEYRELLQERVALKKQIAAQTVEKRTAMETLLWTLKLYETMAESHTDLHSFLKQMQTDFNTVVGKLKTAEPEVYRDINSKFMKAYVNSGPQDPNPKHIKSVLNTKNKFETKTADVSKLKLAATLVEKQRISLDNFQPKLFSSKFSGSFNAHYKERVETIGKQGKAPAETVSTGVKLKKENSLEDPKASQKEIAQDKNSKGFEVKIVITKPQNSQDVSPKPSAQQNESKNNAKRPSIDFGIKEDITPKEIVASNKSIKSQKELKNEASSQEVIVAKETAGSKKNLKSEKELKEEILIKEDQQNEIVKDKVESKTEVKVPSTNEIKHPINALAKEAIKDLEPKESIKAHAETNKKEESILEKIEKGLNKVVHVIKEEVIEKVQENKIAPSSNDHNTQKDQLKEEAKGSENSSSNKEIQLEKEVIQNSTEVKPPNRESATHNASPAEVVSHPSAAKASVVQEPTLIEKKKEDNKIKEPTPVPNEKVPQQDTVLSNQQLDKQQPAAPVTVVQKEEAKQETKPVEKTEPAKNVENSAPISNVKQNMLKLNALFAKQNAPKPSQPLAPKPSSGNQTKSPMQPTTVSSNISSIAKSIQTNTQTSLFKTLLPEHATPVRATIPIAPPKIDIPHGIQIIMGAAFDKLISSDPTIAALHNEILQRKPQRDVQEEAPIAEPIKQKEPVQQKFSFVQVNSSDIIKGQLPSPIPITIPYGIQVLMGKHIEVKVDPSKPSSSIDYTQNPQKIQAQPSLKSMGSNLNNTQSIFQSSQPMGSMTLIKGQLPPPPTLTLNPAITLITDGKSLSNLNTAVKKVIAAGSFLSEIRSKLEKDDNVSVAGGGQPQLMHKNTEPVAPEPRIMPGHHVQSTGVFQSSQPMGSISGIKGTLPPPPALTLGPAINLIADGKASTQLNTAVKKVIATGSLLSEIRAKLEKGSVENPSTSSGSQNQPSGTIVASQESSKANSSMTSEPRIVPGHHVQSAGVFQSSQPMGSVPLGKSQLPPPPTLTLEPAITLITDGKVSATATKKVVATGSLLSEIRSKLEKDENVSVAGGGQPQLMHKNTEPVAPEPRIMPGHHVQSTGVFQSSQPMGSISEIKGQLPAPPALTLGPAIGLIDDGKGISQNNSNKKVASGGSLLAEIKAKAEKNQQNEKSASASAGELNKNQL